MGVRKIAWYAASPATAAATTAPIKAHRDCRSTAITNNATAVIQNARKGRSDSNEFPFTTKAGTAQNNSVAASGCFAKRRASDHMANAAIRENTVYAK